MILLDFIFTGGGWSGAAATHAGQCGRGPPGRIIQRYIAAGQVSSPAHGPAVPSPLPLTYLTHPVSSDPSCALQLLAGTTRMARFNILLRFLVRACCWHPAFACVFHRVRHGNSSFISGRCCAQNYCRNPGQSQGHRLQRAGVAGASGQIFPVIHCDKTTRGIAVTREQVNSALHACPNRGFELPAWSCCATWGPAAECR